MAVELLKAFSFGAHRERKMVDGDVFGCQRASELRGPEQDMFGTSSLAFATGGCTVRMNIFHLVANCNIYFWPPRKFVRR